MSPSMVCRNELVSSGDSIPTSSHPYILTSSHVRSVRRPPMGVRPQKRRELPAVVVERVTAANLACLSWVNAGATRMLGSLLHRRPHLIRTLEDIAMHVGTVGARGA